MKTSDHKIATIPEGKTPLPFVSALKRPIIFLATLFILFNLNSPCFAQKNKITLGVGPGIGYAETPTFLAFGEALYNINPRFSTGLEFNLNTEGISLADGKPFLSMGNALGVLLKTKYYFKDSGPRFFVSAMAGIYNLQYLIYDEYGPMWGYKIPKQNLLGFGLEAGVRFSRRFQLSVAYHQAQSFSVDVDYTDVEQGPGTFTYSYEVSYSGIQLKAGWFFGVF